MLTGELVESKSDFIDGLHHLSWIVQLELLAAEMKTLQERLLSLFDQRRMLPENKRVVDVDDMSYYPDFHPIVRRLRMAHEDENVRRAMEEEDYYWLDMEAQAAELEAKTAALQEKDAALQEKDATLQEKDATLQEKDAALREKESALREKERQELALKQQLLEKEKQALESERKMAEVIAELERLKRLNGK